MEIIIRISTLYGISFLIAMFVAFVIWAVYEIMCNPKFLSRLLRRTKKVDSLSKINSKG